MMFNTNITNKIAKFAVSLFVVIVTIGYPVIVSADSTPTSTTSTTTTRTTTTRVCVRGAYTTICDTSVRTGVLTDQVIPAAIAIFAIGLLILSAANIYQSKLEA